MTEADFQTTQHQLASYLRDPENQAPPEGIEPRRLKIYEELIYNNIESFLCSGFPILRSLYEDSQWHELVRSFVQGHQSETPYFLEISQEFLHFLQKKFVSLPDDKPFILELAHYEWVELALSVSTEQLPESNSTDHDLLNSQLCVSPLAWRLSYQFPVHKIGPKYQPVEPPETPCFLVVYRNSQEKVCFMEVNAVTSRLLQLLEENNGCTGEQSLRLIAEEIGQSFEQIKDFGVELLAKLQAGGIVFIVM